MTLARIFRSRVIWVSDVYVGMHKHARLGGSEIRCSEITTEAIFGTEAASISNIHGLWSVDVCICKPADFKFP